MNKELYYYLLYVAIVLMFTIALFIKKDYVKQNKQKILPLFIGILIATTYMRYGDDILTLSLTSENFLDWVPFHICRITPFLILTYYFTGDKRLFPLIFLFSSFAFAAVLAPVGTVGSMSIGLFQKFTYFYDHLLLTLFPFYLILIEDYKPTKKNLLKPLIFFSTCLLLMFVATDAIGTDWFYLQSQAGFNMYWILFLAVYLASTILTLFIFTLIGGKVLNPTPLDQNKNTKGIIIGISIFILIVILGYLSPFISSFLLT